MMKQSLCSEKEFSRNLCWRCTIGLVMRARGQSACFQPEKNVNNVLLTTLDTEIVVLHCKDMFR